MSFNHIQDTNIRSLLTTGNGDLNKAIEVSGTHILKDIHNNETDLTILDARITTWNKANAALEANDHQGVINHLKELYS